MALRTVLSAPVEIKTSVGMVVGEFWSDRVIGIALKTPGGAERDGYAHSPADLGALIASLGVPNPEAQDVARTFWNQHIAGVWGEWEAHEAQQRARQSRPSMWRRMARHFAKPSH